MTPGDSTPEQQEIIRLQQELEGALSGIKGTIESHMGLIKKTTGGYQSLREKMDELKAAEVTATAAINSSTTATQRATAKAEAREMVQQNMFDRELASRGRIVDASGGVIDVSYKLTDANRKMLQGLDKQIAKEKELLAAKDAPGKAMSDMSSKFKSGSDVLKHFGSELKGATAGSAGLTGTFQLLGAVGTSLTKAFGSMATSVLAGERGSKVGAKALSTFTDELTTATTGIGMAMALIPGFKIATKIIGGIIALLSITAKTAVEVNKQAAEQNDKLFDTFNTLSKSGQSTAGGLTSLIEKFQKFGMSIVEAEKFGTLLGKNSKDLKMMGDAAGSGATKLIEVSGEMYKSKDVGRQLELLGFTAEEQREHTLNYMKQEAMMGQLVGKSQADMVKGAKAYIIELDKMAELTGATRQEQEDAREAVLAEEHAQAAMDEAEAAGDVERVKELKAFASLATAVRLSGDIKGATGIQKIAASGGYGPVDQMSGTAFNQYRGGIEKIKSGERGILAIVEGAEQSNKQMREMARSTVAKGGDVEGFMGSTLASRKFSRPIEASKRQRLPGESEDDAYARIQKEKLAEGDKPDSKLAATIDGNRLLTKAAIAIEGALDAIMKPADMFLRAAKLFNEAVTFARKTAGVKPIAGGEIDTSSSSMYSQSVAGPADPAAAPALPRRSQILPDRNKQLPTAPTPEASPGRSSSGKITTAPAAPTAAAPTAAAPTAAAPTAAAAPAAPTAAPAAAPAAPAAAPAASSNDKSQTTKKGAESLLIFGERTGSQSNFNQLDERLKNRILEAAAEYNETTGKKLIINSAKRNVEDQDRLYKETVAAGRPGIGPKGIPVAKPGGRSKHESGEAVDIQQGISDNVAISALNRKGLTRPFLNDPVHFQLSAAMGGIADGPKSGYPATLHGSEVITPLEPNSILEKLAKTAASDVAPTSSASSTAIEQTMRDMASMHSEMMSMFENKLDDMIDKLGTSNDLQDQLLKYSRV